MDEHPEPGTSSLASKAAVPGVPVHPALPHRRCQLWYLCALTGEHLSCWRPQHTPRPPQNCWPVLCAPSGEGQQVPPLASRFVSPSHSAHKSLLCDAQGSPRSSLLLSSLTSDLADSLELLTPSRGSRVFCELVVSGSECPDLSPPTVLLQVGMGAKSRFSWHRKDSEAADGSPGP